jgi:multidrug resistance efflux pump
VTALIDTDSLRIDAYFEETRLPRIHPGDRVSIRLMGESQRLTGQVESIAGGIEDRERQSGANLLANVNPTFSWVRLAQRIPVRITLIDVPAGVRVIPGRTATVDVVGPGS